MPFRNALPPSSIIFENSSVSTRMRRMPAMSPTTRNGSGSCEGCATLRLQARIERITQPVANQVEAEDRQEDGEARERAEPRGLLEVAAALGQHDSPRRGRRLRAEAEKRERGFDEDGERDRERRLDQERSEAVRQHMV